MTFGHAPIFVPGLAWPAASFDRTEAIASSVPLLVGTAFKVAPGVVPVAVSWPPAGGGLPGKR